MEKTAFKDLNIIPFLFICNILLLALTSYRAWQSLDNITGSEDSLPFYLKYPEHQILHSKLLNKTLEEQFFLTNNQEKTNIFIKKEVNKINRGLAILPTLPELHLRLGEISYYSYLHTTEKERFIHLAKDAFKNAVELAPLRASTYEYIGLIGLWHEKNILKPDPIPFAKYIKRSMELDSTKVVYWYNLFKEKGYPNYVFMKVMPKSFYAYLFLADRLYKDKNFIWARNIYLLALKEAPKDDKPVLWLRLAKLYFDLGMNQEAEKWIEKALSKYSYFENLKELFSLAVKIYVKNGKMEKAEKLSEKNFHLRNDTYSLKEFVSILSTRGEIKKARETLEHWLLSHPSDEKAYIILADLLISNGMYAKALALLKKAIHEAPGCRKCYLLLANTLLKLHDTQGAIFYLNLSLDENPEDLGILLKLAQIYYKIGNLYKAKEFYLKILEISPNHKKAFNEWNRIEKEIIKIKIKDKKASFY